MRYKKEKRDKDSNEELELAFSDEMNVFVQSPKEAIANYSVLTQFALKLGSGGQGME